MIAHLAPAFSLGLLASLSPCVLPLYPGFLAYLANRGGGGTGNTRYLGFLVLAGVLTMLLALGGVFAMLSRAMGELSALVALLGNVIVVALGFALMLNVNPLARLPQFIAPTHQRTPYLSAFAYGLLYGPMTLPCTGPLTITLFSLSLGVAGAIEQLLFFLIYGLGFGLPLVALSLLASARRTSFVRQFRRYAGIISRASGLALAALGLWNLWQGWLSFKLYFGA
jgi:cytochrome c-type biogenesis protein